MSDPGRVVSSEEAAGGWPANVGWGLLLIWTGAALLLDLGWGMGLLGAGAIVLAMQAVRGYLGLHRDRFGVVAGVLLVVCGVWSLFDVSVPLVPLLAIAAGVALLASSWAARRPRHAHGGHPGPLR